MSDDRFLIPGGQLSDTDRALVSTAARWAKQEVIDRRLEHGESYQELLVPATRKLFVDIGLQSLIWPEEFGGAGIDSAKSANALAAVLEQVGRADVGICFLFANTFALQVAVCTKEKKGGEQDRLAKLFCESEEAVVGSLILPDYGDETSKAEDGWHGLTYQATADAVGDGWLLNGKLVRPQCSGADGSLFGVICQANINEPGLLIVDGSSAKLKRGEIFLKTGLAASTNADLEFADLRLPQEALIFSGDDAYQKLLSWYYLGCTATCSGAMLAVWEIVKEWGETRVIKGKGQVFKENPLVAALLGEIGRKISISRLLTYDLAHLLSVPADFSDPTAANTFATASAVVRTVSENALEVANQAMELMASAGYATEWQLERYWRDLKTVETSLGPHTAAQMDLARIFFSCQSV